MRQREAAVPPSHSPGLKGPLAGHFTMEMPVFLCLEEGCGFSGVFMS